MADAEPPLRDAEVRGRPCRASRQPDLGRLARDPTNHDIRERNPSPKASPERLQNSFFRGEPAGQALNAMRAIADLLELLFNETTRDQRVARILDPTAHIRDVDQVYAVSDDSHFCGRFL